MMKFVFELGQQVQITVSGERGEVIGRAEYKSSPPQYFLLFKSSTGRATTQWWEADFISAA